MICSKPRRGLQACVVGESGCNRTLLQPNHPPQRAKYLLRIKPTTLRLDAEPAFVEVKNLSVVERNKIVEELPSSMWAVKLLVSLFCKRHFCNARLYGIVAYINKNFIIQRGMLHIDITHTNCLTK